MNTSLRRFLLAVNATALLTAPISTLCNSFHVSYHAQKKLPKEELRTYESPSVGGILLTLAGIGIGIGALVVGLNEWFTQSDESLYESCKQRCNRLANYYDQEHAVGFYNEKKLEFIITRNSSYTTNHFLYYKEKLESDCAQIKRDVTDVKSRINSLRYDLKKKRSQLTNFEYTTACSIVKRLERLYENQQDLLDFLENLLATVCTMPQYRQEERDRKKERERARDRFDRNFLHQPQVVYVPETSIHLNFR